MTDWVKIDRLLGRLEDINYEIGTRVGARLPVPTAKTIELELCRKELKKALPRESV